MVKLCETQCGSVVYSAPEVLQGIKYNAQLSDMWSIGVVVFMMLQRKYPYDDHKVKALLEEQLSRGIAYNSNIFLGLNARQVIEALLEPNLTKRWYVDDLLQSPWIKTDKR
jgi:serine/threonine protein kinase